MSKKSKKISIRVMPKEAKRINDILKTQDRKNGGKQKSKKRKYEDKEIDDEIKEFL
jgi:hypothetical protein